MYAPAKVKSQPAKCVHVNKSALRFPTGACLSQMQIPRDRKGCAMNRQCTLLSVRKKEKTRQARSGCMQSRKVHVHHPAAQTNKEWYALPQEYASESTGAQFAKGNQFQLLLSDI
eukprot:1156288-Pelagomonas_calceolata.AAC.1